jgi:host factor-I protein
MQALDASKEVIEFALPSTVALKPVLRSEIRIRLEKLGD